MGFDVGREKTGGRAKGTPNKRSEKLLDVLERKSFCPATALIELYEVARQDGDKQLAFHAASELARYSYPKPKAVEQVLVTAVDSMTTQEKLEALKGAVKVMEAEIAAGR